MLLRRKYVKSRSFLPNKIQSYKAQAATYLLQQNMKTFHIYDDKGKKKSIDKLLTDDIQTWGVSLSNELGRLSQGIRTIQGNNALNFIPKENIPSNKKIAYANMICDYRPLKSEKYRVRLTIGGDVLDYFNDAASPAASLLESKLMLNSVISDAHKDL